MRNKYGLSSMGSSVLALNVNNHGRLVTWMWRMAKPQCWLVGELGQFWMSKESRNHKVVKENVTHIEAALKTP
jgi:hypothetical protein